MQIEGGRDVAPEKESGEGPDYEGLLKPSQGTGVNRVFFFFEGQHGILKSKVWFRKLIGGRRAGRMQDG